MQRLAEQIDEIQNLVRRSPVASRSSAAPIQQDIEQPLTRQSYDRSSLIELPPSMNDSTRSDLISADDAQSPIASTQDKIATKSSIPGQTAHTSSSRRERCAFEVQDEPIIDFIARGLITIDQAVSAFRA